MRARLDCNDELVSLEGNSPVMDILESGLLVSRVSIILLEDAVGRVSSSSSPSEACPIAVSRVVETYASPV